MVHYPTGRCDECGAREFARADGGVWCPNCVQGQDPKPTPQAQPEPTPSD